MNYVIYKITNKVNGKVYIGKHQTSRLDDDYFGSGKQLHQAFIKHGKENFVKEILHIFDNESDMNAKEAELVTYDFCKRDDTYNICEGGKGGWSYVNQNKLNIIGNDKKDYFEIAKKSLDTRIKRDKLYHTNKTKLKISENHWSKRNPLEHKIHIAKIHTGKIVSSNTKKLISLSLKDIKKQEIECPHCHKIGGLPVMKRWHFEKCKLLL